MNVIKRKVLQMKKAIKILPFAALAAFFSGCEFTPDDAGKSYNYIIYGISILAGATLLFFVILGIVSAIYKGKDMEMRIVKKLEPNVLRGGLMGKSSPGYKGGVDLSRKARRQKGRMRYTKIIVEFDGQEKTFKCSDIVIFDKLFVGRSYNLRVRFGEIIKIIK